MANLLFKSGFESGVSIGPVYGHNGTASWQDITGTDSTTGYSWPIKVWNPSVSSMQLLVSDPSAAKNTIETTVGHDGTATRALHTQLLAASGAYPQDPYYLEGLHPTGGDLGIKYWVKFDPNLLQQMGPNQWQTFFEWKTGGDYREIVFVYTDANGKPYWHVQEDNNANGGLPFQQFWAADNKDVPVPIGEWFSFETFIHRSGGADGQITTAINGQTIADHHGANMGVNNSAIDRIMLFQNYGGGAKPIGQWIDDIEIWDGKVGTNPAPAPAPSGTPGADVLTVRVAEDAYQGDAQFKVLVDGKQVGGVQTATASHKGGAWNDIQFTGNFGAGAHKIEIQYLNDLSGGSQALDRNLYVDSITLNGTKYEAETTATIDPAIGAKNAGDVIVWSNGTLSFASVRGAAPAPVPTPLPTPTPSMDVLTLRVAEDAYQGDAQFKVLVDGKQVGSIQTVTALHNAGAWNDVQVTGDFGAGAHKVEIQFVNDLFGGSPALDRNLYVDSITLNGTKYEAETTATLDPALGAKNAGDVLVWANGTLTFASVTGGAAAAPAPSPVPATPVIGTPDAKPVPGDSHAFLMVGEDGVAHGTAAAEDIYAMAPGQTLNGGGGNDVFHIGTVTDAKIVVPAGGGVTTVETWATNYTLATGVDDLVAKGNYAHTFTGNAGHNWIVGGNANDVLNGGAGNDVLQVGTGANQLTGGAGKDLFVFSAKAAHDNVIHDFAVGSDMIDLRGAMSSTGYAGSNPLADKYLSLVAHGTGTDIMIDPDGNGAQAGHLLVTVENVLPAQLKIGADYVWH